MKEILESKINKEKALRVNEDFHKKYREFYDNFIRSEQQRTLTNFLVLCENKIQNVPPVYELVFINKYGFFAINFWYINFEKELAVVDVHLYSRGYNNDKGGGGAELFGQSEEILKELGNFIKGELFVIAEDNIISHSMLEHHGYHITNKNDLQRLIRLDEPMRNIPKNSFLRIGNMSPTNEKADLNYRGIRLLTEKYSQIPSMLKIYHLSASAEKDVENNRLLKQEMEPVERDLEKLKTLTLSQPQDKKIG